MPDIVLKYPAGWRGITSVTTEENQQTEIFLPTDSMLIAVNVPKADWSYGSLVIDLTPGNEIDPDRAARLQSLFRVIKYPEGMQNCALGLQLGPSGNKDTKGYFVDRLGGGDPANQSSSNPNGDPTAAKGNKIAIGKPSYFEQGPFDCGTGKCRHKVSEDDEGNPISALHLSTNALFRRDDTLDGPFLFEGELAQATGDMSHRVPVHCSFDPGIKKWYWWTTSPLDGPTVPHDVNIPTNPYLHFGDIVIPTGVASVGIRNGRVQPGTPPEQPPSHPDVPTYDNKYRGITPDGHGLYPFYPHLSGAIPRITDNPAVGLALSTSLSAIAAPAMVAQPQNYSSLATDTGTTSDPNSGSAAKGSNNPISGFASAFGAQGGSTAASGGYGPTAEGASGDPWRFTQSPKDAKNDAAKNSKYKGGTTSGGIVYHPPETDLRDLVAYGMQPPNTTLSKMLVLVGPGAFFGAGIPQLVDGSIQDGFSWGMDPTTGDLLFRSHSNSQGPVEAFRMVKTSQNFRWMSSQSFYGELDHGNTANRVYSFPDKSGTVLVGQAPIADGGGSILLNAHTGGSGPVGTTPTLMPVRAPDGTDGFVQFYQ